MKFGAKGGSAGQKLIYILLNIALVVLGTASVMPICILPFGSWDESDITVICSILLPLATSMTHLLFNCCNLMPGSLSFTDATVADTVVDLALSLVPMAALWMLKEGHSYSPHILAIAAFALLLGKSIKKDFSPPKAYSDGAKKWRWVILVFTIASLAATYGFIAAGFGSCISEDILPVILQRN